MGYKREWYYYPTESTYEIQQIVALCKEAGIYESLPLSVSDTTISKCEGISIHLNHNYYYLYEGYIPHLEERRISLLKLILLLEKRIDDTK